MESEDVKDFECCPPFNPEPWDNKTFTWDSKKFIRAKIRTFLFMPLNFGSVMRKIDSAVREAGAEITDALCLSDHTSKWNMDIYVAVSEDIPGLENITFSGKYYSRVYEGPFRDTGKWCDDFKIAAQSKGLSIKKWYMWYTTCPKCAKKYGKNPVVIITEID